MLVLGERSAISEIECRFQAAWRMFGLAPNMSHFGQHLPFVL
jgi:hypothetical protein